MVVTRITCISRTSNSGDLTARPFRSRPVVFIATSAALHRREEFSPLSVQHIRRRTRPWDVLILLLSQGFAFSLALYIHTCNSSLGSACHHNFIVSQSSLQRRRHDRCPKKIYHSLTLPSGPWNPFGGQGSVSLLIFLTNSSSISIPNPGPFGASTYPSLILKTF
jgi:hypothetical protein